MKRPKHATDHTVAPKAWRHTPNMTGDYDLDASIMYNNNKALPSKLPQHLISEEGAYGPHRYSGYNGYKGDD